MSSAASEPAKAGDVKASAQPLATTVANKTSPAVSADAAGHVSSSDGSSAGAATGVDSQGAASSGEGGSVAATQMGVNTVQCPYTREQLITCGRQLEPYIEVKKIPCSIM